MAVPGRRRLGTPAQDTRDRHELRLRAEHLLRLGEQVTDFMPRGTISQLVHRGALDRHPDGGVLRASIMQRIAQRRV